MTESPEEVVVRISLVNPSWLRFRGRKLAAMPDLYPPMGLGCIASTLRSDGFDVEILDLPILGVGEDDDDRILDLLFRSNPAIVGFTTVTMTYPTAARLARSIRSIRPDLPLIVGGIHVTDAPETTLADDCFDYSVAGEGEMPALELCRGLRDGHVRSDIPGVGYHRASPPYLTPRGDFAIDSYPPTAYDLFDLARYRAEYQRMSIMTSRGCNARCVFCSSGYSLPRVKFLPIERILNELRFLVRDVGFRFINVYDSNFTFRNTWVHEICDAILNEGLRFRWRCFSKTNGVDLELFRKMHAAGCSHVLFGVESSHDRTLARIKKGNRRHHVERAFRDAREAGLKVIAYSIVGLPDETREDVLETIDFLERLAADWNVISPISLMPGTPLHDRMTDYGMSMTDPDWKNTSQGVATATNGHLDGEEMEELCDFAFRRLNGGRESYEWHLATESDPGTCPHISMMTLVDPVRDED